MGGETDPDRLLSGLAPRLDPEPHGFAVIDGEVPTGLAWVALVREDEGLTVIAPQAALARAGLDPGGPWARITLTVHSALEAVGLTAAVSAALAEGGIPANMIAGFHHDQILVPWEQRVDALSRLKALRG